MLVLPEAVGPVTIQIQRCLRVVASTLGGVVALSGLGVVVGLEGAAAPLVGELLGDMMIGF